MRRGRATVIDATLSRARPSSTTQISTALIGMQIILKIAGAAESATGFIHQTKPRDASLK
jgi:hypothetical protein